MPSFDTAASAQLDTDYVAPAWFVFLDVLDDPIQATTYGKAVTFSGTGDSDLDGQTFAVPTDPTLLSIGDVAFSEGGTDTISVFLSGMVTIDTAILNAIGNRANWFNRVVRLWCLVFDASGTQQGAITAWATGYMTAVDIHPSPETQTIEVKLENWNAALSAASNRSYMGQKDYDPSDVSAAATLAAANNARGAAAATVGGGGGGGGGGGSAGADRIFENLK